MAVWTRTVFLVVTFSAATMVLAGDERPAGYLAPGEFDVTHILEPAPRPGDPRYEADRKVFRATRHLIGTPRWDLATHDAEISTTALLRDFSCSVGAALTTGNAPRLVHVLISAGIDTSQQTNQAKDVYMRGRPYTIDRGRICQPETELYDSKAHRVSYDYPSGHTTRGWTYAVVLSSLAPDRAQQIMERARAYGDSRFVCGAHNESAVEAGMLSASATMTVVSAKPLYQTDMAAARDELRALRAVGSPPQGCEAEAKLVRLRVMPKFSAVP